VGGSGRNSPGRPGNSTGLLTRHGKFGVIGMRRLLLGFTKAARVSIFAQTSSILIC
jgi:hypothetical protein